MLSFTKKWIDCTFSKFHFWSHRCNYLWFWIILRCSSPVAQNLADPQRPINVNVLEVDLSVTMLRWITSPVVQWVAHKESNNSEISWSFWGLLAKSLWRSGRSWRRGGKTTRCSRWCTDAAGYSWMNEVISQPWPSTVGWSRSVFTSSELTHD